jgi:hypothetical protein
MAIPELHQAKTYREIGRRENFEFAAIVIILSTNDISLL